MLPIKTLIIAPYEGLKDAIIGLLPKYPQINADIFVADLNDAVTLLEELKNNDYEVIISRGGTADFLRMHTSIPVIEISISIYDLLRGIKMAESFSNNIIIAGFRIFTENAVMICNLLQYSIPIYTIKNEQEASDCLQTIIELYGRNSVILCDKIMQSYSNNAGMNSILITSGSESIDSAIQQAVQVVKNKRMDQMIVKCLEISLTSSNIRMLIYNEEQACVYSSNFDAKELKWIQKNVEDIFLHNNHKKRSKYRQVIDDQTLEMISSHMTYDDRIFYVFTIKSHEKSPFTQNNGVKIFHNRDLKKLRTKRIHNLISFSQEFIDQLKTLSLSSYPTLLIGESGTGKAQGAYFMYEMGNHTENPLYVIDCSILTERNWKYLISHENSPFFDIGSTINFKNVQDLNNTAFSWLMSQLLYSDFYENNKYIFSIVKGNQGHAKEYIPLLSNHHYINRLYFPAVRERMEHFSAYCALYLNEYNTRFGKQVIGFAPNAMDLMKSYSWPYNLNQLKRVLKELIVKTTTPYILFDDVNSILSSEAQKDHVLLDGYYGINIRKPLNEINKDILHFVLEEENGNQTRAAKRLGLSRGTIWKMLKE